MSTLLQPRRALWAAFFVLLTASAAPSGGQSPKPVRRARPPEFDATLLGLLGGDSPLWPQDELPRWMEAASRGIAVNPATPGDSSPSGRPDPGEEGDSSWSDLADAAAIEDEIKATAVSLQAPMASPSRFSAGGYRDARDAFLVLSRLFRVVAEYEGEIRWARVAEAASSRFAAAGELCNKGDAAVYNAASTAADDLQRILRGSSLPPGDQVDAYTSDLGPIMRRLESAEREQLPELLADERSFRDRDAVAHEAAVVALLARDAASEDYDYAGDDAYAAYSQELIEAASSLRTATGRGDFEGARTAFSALRQACDACHGDYR